MTLGEQTYDYFMNQVATFETEEGDMTAEFREVQADGAEDITQIFEFPILKGNFLVVESVTSEGVIRVENAPGGAQNILGIAFQKATPRKGEGETIPSEPGVYDGSPGFPTVHREVSVEILGDFIREVPLGTSGVTTVLGASIKPHSSEQHVWEGDATPNDTYVLKTGIPGTDPTTVAVFGHNGRY